VPEYAALQQQVQQAQQRMSNALTRRLGHVRERLRLLCASTVFTRPYDRINQTRLQVDELYHQAETQIDQSINKAKADLKVLAGKLDSLSPLATLGRGYAVCRLLSTGVVVKRAGQVKPGAKLRLQLSEGEVLCKAEEQIAPISQTSLPI
jgi:exodeoxyribonuclease VII large subunit